MCGPCYHRQYGSTARHPSCVCNASELPATGMRCDGKSRRALCQQPFQQQNSQADRQLLSSRTGQERGHQKGHREQDGVVASTRGMAHGVTPRSEQSQRSYDN